MGPETIPNPKSIDTDPRFSPALKLDVGTGVRTIEGKSCKATKMNSVKKLAKAKTLRNVSVIPDSTKKSYDFASLVQKGEKTETSHSKPTEPPKIKLFKSTEFQSPDFSVLLSKEIEIFGDKFREKIENILKVKETQIMKLRQMNSNLEMKNSKLMEDLSLGSYNPMELVEIEKRKFEVAQENLNNLKALVVPLKGKLEEQHAEIENLKKDKNDSC